MVRRSSKVTRDTPIFHTNKSVCNERDLQESGWRPVFSKESFGAIDDDKHDGDDCMNQQKLTSSFCMPRAVGRWYAPLRASSLYTCTLLSCLSPPRAPQAHLLFRRHTGAEPSPYLLLPRPRTDIIDRPRLHPQRASTQPLRMASPPRQTGEMGEMSSSMGLLPALPLRRWF
jgi:hypothetical protein